MVRVVIALALLLVSVSPAPTRAAFHTALISEVMSGVNGDPSVQYVEIRVISGVASAVSGSVLTAFNCAGTSSSVLLTVPHNITHGAMDEHWIMATTNFAAVAGITPDFTWNPVVSGNIDPSCGMVCWGAPGLVPPMPVNWDTTDRNNYVDCVGYGGYAGTRKTSTPASGFPTGNPPGDGMQSLTRLTASESNLADFQLADPTPTNNAGDIGVFGGATTTTTTAPGNTTTTDTAPTTTATTVADTSTTTVTVPHVTTTTTLPPETACAPSVGCDDGDACSVDHCVVGTGCVHDPVSSAADLDLVGPACTGQNVPSSVGQQFAKGCGLVETARAQTPKKAKGSLTKAARAFGRAAGVAAKAGKRKKAPVSADCAAALHGVLGSARDQALRTKSGL